VRYTLKGATPAQILEDKCLVLTVEEDDDPIGFYGPDEWHREIIVEEGPIDIRASTVEEERAFVAVYYAEGSSGKEVRFPKLARPESVPVMRSGSPHIIESYVTYFRRSSISACPDGGNASNDRIFGPYTESSADGNM
jgi:hypothetical protein